MANKGFQIGSCEDVEFVDCKSISLESQPGFTLELCEEGCTFEDCWTETDMVLSNDVPAVVKFVARIAKRFLGARIQICDGVEDDTEVQAAHDALPGETREARKPD